MARRPKPALMDALQSEISALKKLVASRDNTIKEMQRDMQVVARNTYEQEGLYDDEEFQRRLKILKDQDANLKQQDKTLNIGIKSLKEQQAVLKQQEESVKQQEQEVLDKIARLEEQIAKVKEREEKVAKIETSIASRCEYNLKKNLQVVDSYGLAQSAKSKL